MKKVAGNRRRAVQRRTRSRKKSDIRLYQELRQPSRIWRCPRLADTKRLAKILANGRLPNVWLLQGPLGSGKTTLVREVLRSLGYTEKVTSPTFVLRNDYAVSGPIWRRVVHVDAYRIRDHREEAALDLSAATADPRCLVLIEWPERLTRLPGERQLRITLRHLPRGRGLALSQAV